MNKSLSCPLPYPLTGKHCQPPVKTLRKFILGQYTHTRDDHHPPPSGLSNNNNKNTLPPPYFHELRISPSTQVYVEMFASILSWRSNKLLINFWRPLVFLVTLSIRSPLAPNVLEGNYTKLRPRPTETQRQPERTLLVTKHGKSSSTAPLYCRWCCPKSSRILQICPPCSPELSATFAYPHYSHRPCPPHPGTDAPE